MRHFALVLMVSLVTLGCSSTSNQVGEPVAESDSTATVLKGLRERSDLVKQLHGYGVIELTWSDEQGDHFEQGDMEFWIDGQDRRALRISKLGEAYFWVGMDGKKAWVFDLSGSPRRLYTDSMAVVEASRGSDSTLPIPEMLRIMQVGLGMVPPPPSSKVTACRAGPAGTWSLESRGVVEGSRDRVEVDSDTWRPVRVELLNSNGTEGITLQATSDRIVRIEIPNRSSLGWPRVSAVMEVAQVPDRDSRAKFAFERLTTDLSDQPLDRVFDLEILRQALRPEVEGPMVNPEPGDDTPAF